MQLSKFLNLVLGIKPDEIGGSMYGMHDGHKYKIILVKRAVTDTLSGRKRK